MKLSEIAEALGGKLVGDGDIEIETLAHPSEATGDGCLALAMEENLLELLPSSDARAAIVLADGDIPEGSVDGYIEVGRARVALGRLMDIYEMPIHHERGVHSSAVIESTATIGKDVSIGPFVYVGPKAVVGDGTILMAQVTIGA